MSISAWQRSALRQGHHNVAARRFSIQINTPANLQTTEHGGQARFAVKLGSPSKDEVTLPVASTMPGEGQTEPKSLSFTPQNRNVEQQVTVASPSDCIPDGNRLYQVNIGKASSLDPQYMGQASTPVQLTNLDYAPAWTTTTNNQNVRICALTVKSQRKVDATTWEYGWRRCSATQGRASGVEPPSWPACHRCCNWWMRTCSSVRCSRVKRGAARTRSRCGPGRRCRRRTSKRVRDSDGCCW